jgi:hypothetical protein
VKSLEGKTVSTVSENWDGEGEWNGIIIECTDGSKIALSVDYEDVELVASLVG